MAILDEVEREVLNARTPITLYYRSLAGTVGGITGSAINTRQWIVYCAVSLS
jgi:hypothetical protein